MENLLWYTSSPNGWDEGLLIGNGRLAANILNYDSKDVIYLNHEFLWTGLCKKREIYNTPGSLEEVRRLIKAEKYFEATMYANNHLGRDGDEKKYFKRYDSYQPAGELVVEFDDTILAKRELNIETGIASSRRTRGGSIVTGKCLAHPEINNIFCFYHGRIDCKIHFERENDDRLKERTTIGEYSVKYNANFIGGTEFCVSVELHTDAKTIVKDNCINLFNGSYLILIINIATDKMGIDEELSRYSIKEIISEDEIVKTHSAIFSSYMGRMKLDLGEQSPDLPTDERLKRFAETGTDEGMFSLYLNYARYLLLSSSISGELPANLQGKWNDKLAPPWNCDYHFDINLQMNYWIAENGNLQEADNALFNYIESFYESGADFAKKVFNSKGIWLPLGSDCYGEASLDSRGWDLWIGAAPWIAQHYYKHFLYTGDLDFLKNRAYPFFKRVVEFYEGYLVKCDDGKYHIMPSQSPENSFIKDLEFEVSLGDSSAMDVQLAYDAFTYAIEAAKLLNLDTDSVLRWESIRANLPDFKIGIDGRLLEWNKEFFERDPGHRHLSHLYGVFPSNLFTPETRVAQYEASKKSLAYRIEHLGGHTGWSRAWTACLYSSMQNSEGFYNNIRYLIGNFSTTSLLDLHPPGVFQIDGNFGGAEAIILSLVQCKDDKIYILPALPKKWSTGSFTGVKTVGGHTLNMSWENSSITNLEITFGYEHDAVFKLNNGKIIKVTGELGMTSKVI